MSPVPRRRRRLTARRPSRRVPCVPRLSVVVFAVLVLFSNMNTVSTVQSVNQMEGEHFIVKDTRKV